MVRTIILFIKGIFIYLCDLCFFVKYSNVDSTSNSEAKLLSTLIASYHIIEKGLSMPNRRLGFGAEALKSLISKCNLFEQRYGSNNGQFQYAISIIKEYDDLHKENHFELEKDLQDSINTILARHDVPAAEQMKMNKEEFFASSGDSFDKFSISRHSMRHFDGSVDIERILHSMELAQHAPSACNKQIIKSYIVTKREVVQTILDMQQGNRGFGHLIDKVIVITTRYCGCTRYSDRFYPFVDAGIYTMNMLYALHYNKIGAIPLVWLSSKERDSMLKKYIDANNDEIPCMIVGIGEVANNIVCATSPRKNINETVIIC